MKRIITSARKSVFPLLFIVATSGISQLTLANNYPARPAHPQDVEIRYLPGKTGELRFNVLYNNASGARFSVAILDETGNQLYQDTYTDKRFDKVYQLSDSDITGKLIFVIRNFGDNSVQRFEVHAVDRMIEDVEVKEIK
jgi:hypothetical protein